MDKTNERSNIQKRIVAAMPIETEFRAVDIVDEVFPNLVKSDSEGRTYNMGVATVARELRKIQGILERPHGVFWAVKWN